MSEAEHAAELADLQAALARLQPAPDGINVGRLLFEAGRRSAARWSWAWPCVSAASMMLAAALGTVLLLRPVPQPAERIVEVFVSRTSETPVPPEKKTDETLVPPSQPLAATDSEPRADDGNYLHLRRAVLAKGVEALPAPAPWPTITPADETNTLLDMPAGSREPWLLRFKRSLKSGDSL